MSGRDPGISVPWRRAWAAAQAGETIEKKRNLTENLRHLLKDARLVATPLPLTPEIRLYLLNEDYPQAGLTDDERRLLMDAPPFWVFCWASGQVLARWLRDREEYVSGKRVLDIGSGSGVVALAAALSGAREVVALDTDHLACEAVRANAGLNGVAITAEADLDCLKGDFDLILAADILYDRQNLQLLNSLGDRTSGLVVADSRMKELPDPFIKIGTGRAITCPDLEEPEEYQYVSIFSGVF